MNLKNWAQLLLLSTLWGGSFFFVEIAVTGLPVFTIVFLRVFFGALLILLILKLNGRKMPSWKGIWLSFLVMGLLNNVIPFALIARAQQSIDSGFASLLNAATPFFTVLVAHIFTKDEKMTPTRTLGVILGVLGVAILIGFDSFSSDANRAGGVVAVLSATISYAFAGVWGKRFKALSVEPLAAAAGQLFGSSVLLLPLVLFVNRPWQIAVPSSSVLLSVLALAVFSSALAYIIYFRILDSSGATNVLLVTLLIPVTAILLGVIFLSEDFHMRYLWGMMVIAMGLAVVDGRIFGIFRGRRNVRN